MQVQQTAESAWESVQALLVNMLPVEVAAVDLGGYCIAIGYWMAVRTHSRTVAGPDIVLVGTVPEHIALVGIVLADVVLEGTVLEGIGLGDTALEDAEPEDIVPAIAGKVGALVLGVGERPALHPASALARCCRP